ncbi:MutL C terminal dimerization domain protein [Cryptosporidium felis]|nr:MutL C terminal dimerization domain protein [Cryptosporidium felis]
MLRKLSKEDQDRICSQQVITELRDCVKELVDNAIDAKCTEVLISLTDYGASAIEVLDDGTGIVELELIGERGSTSKLESFYKINEDLDTLGFRGEGLNSIINSSEFVEIDSKCKENENRIVFDQGKCSLCESNYREKYKFSYKTGTRVRVIGLFLPYVSRRAQFLRNTKSQLKSLIILLEEYAICYPTIRFLLSNRILSDAEREKTHKKLAGLELKQQAQQTQVELFMTRGKLSSQKDVAQYLWGKSILGNSLDLNLQGEIFIPKFGVINTRPEEERSQESLIGGKWSITGFISPLDKGRPSPDYQIFSINKRPIDPIKRISRSISSIHSTLSSVNGRKLHPAFVINMNLPQSLLDVNVTPSKRTVILPPKVENILIENIQQFLFESYQNIIPLKKETNGLEGCINKLITEDENAVTSDLCELSSQLSPNNTSLICTSDNIMTSNKSTSISGTEIDSNAKNIDTQPHSRMDHFDGSSDPPKKKNKLQVSEPTGTVNPQVSDKNMDVQNDNSNINNKSKSVEDKPLKMQIKIKLGLNIPIKSILELKYQKAEQEKKWRSRNLSIQPWNSHNGESLRTKYLPNDDIVRTINKNERGNGLSDPNDGEKQSSFNFEKKLFNELEVIGQFNKGFILTKLTRSPSDSGSESIHIFIIDQHASDEKARFEKYNRDLNLIQTQTLISPLPIALTPSQEQLVLHHKDIFDDNGFKFIFDQNLDIGSRVRLIQMPVVLGIPLKQIDFMDLLSQINKLSFSDKISSSTIIPSSMRKPIEDNERCETDSEDLYHDSLITAKDDSEKIDITLWCPSNVIPRPRKIWSILASKACRGAVMIGDDLNRHQMKNIIRTMSTLKSPWNCPHGRPSIRHLGHFTTL